VEFRTTAPYFLLVCLAFGLFCLIGSSLELINIYSLYRDKSLMLVYCLVLRTYSLHSYCTARCRLLVTYRCAQCSYIISFAMLTIYRVYTHVFAVLIPSCTHYCSRSLCSLWSCKHSCIRCTHTIVPALLYRSYVRCAHKDTNVHTQSRVPYMWDLKVLVWSKNIPL
jgi:hypothetical protein